ncbi:MAG: apolipoprotein N-acyltransferase [Kiritimatiellae bacterium]|nr:apolipoprotein N-acyltransferase [Kiritimatiellia bacterium]
MSHRSFITGAKAAGAVLSGLLLWTAFPPQAQADSAWMALAPLFLVIRHSRPKAAAGWAWLAGLIFWLSTLSWFPAIIKNNGPWPLVLAGQAGLSLWCASFMALYAYASCRVWRWAGAAPGWRRVAAALAADPLMWSGTELLRGWLFSGFAWNFLGVSQVANLPLIQVASVAGVYGVSALLVLANGAVASLIERAAGPVVRRLTRAAGDWEAAGTALRPGLAGRLWGSAESFAPLALVIACWFWGFDRIESWRRTENALPVWRVALIQPNSPCVFTFNDDTMRRQLDLLLKQTGLAGAAKPDLAVWPETAVLGSVPHEPETMRLIRAGAAAAGAPLLTGTLETEHAAVTPATPEGMFFYNAAWLFSAGGEKMGVYRKRHLVPFGEHIPLDKRIPWLQRLAPTGVSCTPGEGPGVMSVPRQGDPAEVLRLGPLICFEDTVPGLSRDAVRAGARLLVLMTNDAWFNGSVEPIQHLQQSVFRAVENGVPLVRAANSGVSGTVDAVGRVRLLESNGAVADFDGFMVSPVGVPREPLAAPYTLCGDWLLGIPGAFLAAAVCLCGVCGYGKKRN